MTLICNYSHSSFTTFVFKSREVFCYLPVSVISSIKHHYDITCIHPLSNAVGSIESIAQHTLHIVARPINCPRILLPVYNHALVERLVHVDQLQIFTQNISEYILSGFCVRMGLALPG